MEFEGRYGKKIEYDPLWKGPIRNNRSLTDLTWLIIFLIFFVVYISCGIYALKSGNLNKINTNDLGKTTFAKSHSTRKCEVNDKCFKVPIITAIICGGILAFISVILLKWFALPFFYATICLFCVYISFGIFVLANEYARTSSSWSLMTLIILVVLIVIIILVVIFSRKKIRLACQLVKESSKAVMHLPVTLFYPIFSLLLYLLIVVFSITVLISLTTIKSSNHTSEKLGNRIVTDDSDNSLINTFTNDNLTINGRRTSESENQPAYVYFLHAINIFGFYWVFFFISGLQYLVLGGTFGTWYWSFNKDNVGNYSLIESISRSLRYHLGTVAIGSFILAIVQIIRLILKTIEDSLRQSNNPCLQILFCCFRHIIDLLNALLSFLTYNAYIMCALHGENFCKSAKSSFKLIMRNLLNIIVLDTVADLLFTMAILLITSLAVGAVYLYSDRVEPLPLQYALTITALGTAIVASVIFSVQNVAVRTIFLCLVEDIERNDGSNQRPYYMSHKLRHLFNI